MEQFWRQRYPSEIDDMMSRHPGIFECAAFGVPDPKSGVVVKKDPALTEADVRRYCDEQLTGCKRPRFIEFRDELTKSAVGKILRRELRQPSAAST